MSTRAELIEHAVGLLHECAWSHYAGEAQKIRAEGRPEVETQAWIARLRAAILQSLEKAEREIPAYIDSCIALHEQHCGRLH